MQPRICISLELLEHCSVFLSELLKFTGGKECLNFQKSKYPRDFLQLEVFLEVLKSLVYFETS